MNQKTYEFKLVRTARGSGGDRYETQLENKPKPWTVYFPQEITRAFGDPKRKIKLTLE